MRRSGRPGLIGLAARTAVVAGTANAVTNKQQQRAVANQQAAANAQQVAAAQRQAEVDAAAQQAVAAHVAAQAPVAPPAPAAPAPAVPAGGGIDIVAEIQKLGALKEAGLLTDEEFTAAKAKLLG